MYTAGLVARTANDELARDALEKIQAAGPFTLGAVDSGFVSLALQTDDPRQARDWHEWVQALPGIQSLEVVFVHWDQQEQEECDERHGLQSA